MSFDPRPYIDGILRANSRERREIARRAKAARAEARRLARLIARSDESVRAVYLFGSLAAGEPNRLEFDIDLAVQGGDIYRAMERVEDSQFDVDLVDLDRVPDHVRQAIVERGAVLAER